MKKVMMMLVGCWLSLCLESSVACAMGDGDDAKQSISPLYDAVLKNDVAAVRRLIEEKADVNVLDHAKIFTPLRQAVSEDKSIEVVRLLLENRADPDMNTGNMCTSSLELAERKVKESSTPERVAVRDVLRSYSRFQKYSDVLLIAAYGACLLCACAALWHTA